MKSKKLFIVLLTLTLTLACSLGALTVGDEDTASPEQPAEDLELDEPASPPEEKPALPHDVEILPDFTRPADGMLMLYIPEGEFIMGQNESPFRPEKPAHLVYLDGYWMDQTEVSNAMYRQCVEAGVCSLRQTLEDPKLNGDQQPALVTWEDAHEYCTWAEARLPTEAEWEKAARGTDERLWPWGNEFEPGRANLSGGDDGYKLTAPVGVFPSGASPYGLLDMAGNASEWVADWFDVEYYAHSSEHNPTGPASGEQKVYRSSIANGGSGPEKCRAIARYPGDPASVKWLYGFRCTVSQPIEP